MTLSPGAKGFHHISVVPPILHLDLRRRPTRPLPPFGHAIAQPVCLDTLVHFSTAASTTPPCPLRAAAAPSPARRRRAIPCAPPTPSEPAHHFALRLDVVRDHVRALVRPRRPVSTSPRSGSRIRHGRDLELVRPPRASVSTPSSPGVSSSVGALVARLRTNRAAPVTSSRNAAMPPPRTCR